MSVLHRSEKLVQGSHGKISQSKKKEFSLKEKLPLILDAIPSAILYVNKEHLILYANTVFEKIFNIHSSDIPGSTIFELFGKENLELLKEYNDKVMRGQPGQGELDVQFQGKLFSIQINYSPDTETDGTVNGYLVLITDVTERKEAGKNLARLAAIVHSSNDAIISKTLNSIITSWNEGAQRIFGYTPEEMIGQPVTKLIPSDRLNEEALIIDRLRKGEVVEHFETKRITKDNQLIDVSLTISPVKDSKGKIIGASKIARDITTQKKLEQTIRESEERFRMTIEATKLGTWEYDPSTTTLICSSESRKICGLPENVDPTFEMIADHIVEEDKNLFYEEIKSAIDYRNNGRFDMQLRVKRYNDKDIRWLRAQGKVFFSEGLQPARLIGTMLDITDEKMQELELKSSVELFTTMAENVPAMIWMSGDDRYADYFNKTWLEFTGRTQEEESNERWLENVHPDDVQRCVDGYNEAYREQRGHYVEYRLKRHDGQYRWIADNSVPRYNSDGTFAGFISACIDIDDQKNFREKIMESELRLKTISNASPVGLWMTDATGQCLFVNETWIDWTGVPFEKQMGMGWFDAVMESDRQDAWDLFLRCLTIREKYHVEFRITRPDGTIHWCLTEGFPYFNMDGDFAGYAGSVTDITEIRKMEERKDDFIKMASHELKTPITSIKGYVQLLLNIYNEFNEDKFQSSKPIVRSSLQTISKQVSKLTRLVSELLDLSRIESGKLELHKTEFDLSDLVEETVQDVRYTTSSHALIVHCDFDRNIYADKDRISQVLLNLLTNAIKYSPAADNVEIFVEGDDKKVKIRVRDQGIGIDKKDHEKIFHRFYRVEGKSEQTYPGFGIGLFIASEIVQRHGGSIQVSSKKNEGAEFVVTLPIGLDKRPGVHGI